MALENFSQSEIEQCRPHLSPEYLAGGADGSLRAYVRKFDVKYIEGSHFTDEDTHNRLEIGITVESKNKRLVRFWADFLGRKISNSVNRLSINSVDDCLNLTTNNPVFENMYLRKDDFIILHNIAEGIVDVRKERHKKKLARMRERLKVLYDYFYYDREFLFPVQIIEGPYLAGLFELSPKGTVRYEMQPRSKANRRMIVQLGVRHFEFANHLQIIYGGLISPIFTKKGKALGVPSSYAWKLAGGTAEKFYNEVLAPNFQFGGIDFNEEQ